MKYKCNDCGETFDENDIVTKEAHQSHEFHGYGIDEDISTSHCPYCNSTDIDEYVDELEGYELVKEKLVNNFGEQATYRWYKNAKGYSRFYMNDEYDWDTCDEDVAQEWFNNFNGEERL